MTTADPRHVASTRLHRFGPLALMLASVSGLAQDAGEGETADTRSFSFTPRLAVTESVIWRRPDGGSSRTESITSVAPGLRFLSRAGRLQGTVDYSLSAQYGSRSSGANGIRHSLAAQLSAEAIRDHLYADFVGNIGRQPISAFGVQSATPSQAGQNYTDVQTYTFTPVLRGTLLGAIDMQARGLVSSTNTGNVGSSDSSRSNATVHVGSVPSPALFGWGLDASRDVVVFNLGRRTEEDRLVAGLSFRPSSEFSVTVRGGTENSDVVSREKKRIKTYGTSILWTPTERTRFSAEYDKRAFGSSHAFQFEHRMKRSVWRYTDTQALTTGSNSAGIAVPAFDLFNALFKRSEPDPVLREQQVDSFLQANNLQRNQLIRGGFLTAGSAIERRQELSFAVEDVRTTYLLSAVTTRTERAFQVVGVVDDLQFGALRQRGLTFLINHRVTPTARANMVLSTQRTSSESVLQNGGRLDSVLVGWTDKLSRRTDYLLNLRYSTYNGSVGGYNELGLVGGLNLRF